MYDSIQLGQELLEKLNEKEKKDTQICKGCAAYEKFKKDCHFYWENKKFCSQHTDKNINFNF